MRYEDAHKLLFHFVTSEKLLYEATMWRVGDRDSTGPIAAPSKKPPQFRASRSYQYSDIDHDAVKVMLLLFSSLGEEGRKLKLKNLSQAIPLELSKTKINIWAKNMKWCRYEAAILSLGYIVDDRSRDQFISLMFGRETYASEKFTVTYFPLLEAFRERDRMLANSGLFDSEYVDHYERKASALEIVAWFERMEIALPDGLSEKVKKFQTLPHENSETKKNSTTDKREISSMLSLIHAMSVHRPFRYDPEKTHNGAIRRIEQATIDAGVQLSDTTIRNYLRRADVEAKRKKDLKM